jgi:hypothetical protein
MIVESDTPATEPDDLDVMASLLGDETPDQERDEAAPEQPEEVEASEEQEDQEPETATLKELEIDGKKYKLPAELEPYILRQQDYTRKTMEVAEQRKAVEAEAMQARQFREQYSQGLGVIQKALQTMAPQPPDQAMLQDDPIEYMRQRELFQAHQQKLHAVAQEQARVLQMSQQEQKKEFVRQQQEAIQRLPELIPAWKDPEKAKAEAPQLAKYLMDAGYTKEEVESASDPRAISLTRKAWLYDQLIARQKTAKPVATPTVQPGASKPISQGKQKILANALRPGAGESDVLSALESLL